MAPRHLRLGERIASSDGWIEAAFLTDLHLQRFRNVGSKFNYAIQEVLTGGTRPHVLLIGGDIVMNSVSCDLERAREQWGIWLDASGPLEDIPLLSALGNQDVWGWNRKESGCSGFEPLYGKPLAQEVLRFEASAGIYELGEWTAVVLDPITEGGKYGFDATVPCDQLCLIEEAVCERPSKPILVLCHFPALPGPGDFQSLEFTQPNAKGEWVLPGNQVLTNGYALMDRLKTGTGTRVFLNGHTHMQQYVHFQGIHFVTAPPLCGAWWRGDLAGAKPGFARLRLGPQGEFTHQFINLDYTTVQP